MSQGKPDIIIIGAGIIGLCSAYFLQKAGLKVQVLEASDTLEGCSHGNAGHICQSHIQPLANPEVFKKSILWLLNSKSPFYIRPRLNPEFISWGRRFMSSSFDKDQLNRTMFLARFGKASLKSYHEIFREIGFEEINKEGIITLCNSEEGINSEREMAELNRSFDIIPKEIDQESLKSLEPNVDLNIKGGILYKDDFSVDPSRLIGQLFDHLKSKGIEFKFGERVSSLEGNENEIWSVRTNSGVLKADNFLICTGAWAPKLWNQAGEKIFMQPAKGYSFDISNHKQVRSSSLIFAEKKVVVTPMGSRLRIAGTLELSGFDDRIRKNRVDGIVEGLREFAPDLLNSPPKPDDIWYGYRPTTPDGLAYIGPHRKFRNLLYPSKIKPRAHQLGKKVHEFLL